LADGAAVFEDAGLRKLRLIKLMERKKTKKPAITAPNIALHSRILFCSAFAGASFGESFGPVPAVSSFELPSGLVEVESPNR
jgi:hypothetical protein